jgi:hypothetical protein
VIEVNTVGSAITPLSDIFLEGRSGQVLPDLVSRIEAIMSGMPGA